MYRANKKKISLLISLYRLSSAWTDKTLTYTRILIDIIFSVKVHFFIDFDMLYFKVLVKRALWSIRSLTSLNWTSVMSLNFIRCSSEPFFSILIVGLSKLNFLTFLLKFDKASGKLIPFISEFSHLTEKNYICKIQSAVFVIIWEISLWVGTVHDLSVC